MRKISPSMRQVLKQQSRESSRLFLLVRIRTPTPSPVGECVPSPLWFRSTHSLAGEGVGGSQFGRGDRHCGTLCIYVLSIWNFRKVVFKYFTQNLLACFSFSPLLKKRWWWPLWQSEQPNIPLRWRLELRPEQVRPFSTSSISEHFMIFLSTLRINF